MNSAPTPDPLPSSSAGRLRFAVMGAGAVGCYFGALLARAGQDLSAYGLRYSHLGWAYKTAEGPWRVAHTAVRCWYRKACGVLALKMP